MRPFLVAASIILLCGFIALPVTVAQQSAQTGWISDAACGADHMKPGGADCVRKCWRGGASIGHPEWKPQRAVFVSDDKQVFVIENPDAVKDFPGAHVRITGDVSSDKKSVHVGTIRATD